MYPVSETYKSAISANVRNGQAVKGQLKLNDGTNITLGNSNIVSGSLSYTAQIGDGFGVGGVSAAQLELGLITDLSNPYNLYGARIDLSYGIVTAQSDDGSTWEWVPLGIFYVKEISRQSGYVTVTAYDGFIKMDVWSESLVTSGTLELVLRSCLNDSNITGDLSNLSTFPNYDTTINVAVGESIETMRDCVMWICQLLGCFGRINRDGIFELVHLSSDSVKTIAPGERSGSTSVEDSLSYVKQITMTVDDNDYIIGTEEPTLELEENPLMAGWSTENIITALTNILTEVSQAVFMPMTCSLFGDPALMPGDYVTLSDTATLLEDNPSSLITSMTWTFRGEHTLTSDGVDTDSVYSQTNKTVSSIKKIADAAKVLAEASNDSTELIRQALGGNILIRQNTGETNEILIMDSSDPEKAVKIWRWNMGGLGYSDNCTGADNADRVYKTAITMDGTVSADFVKTGILQSQTGNSWINLNTGTFCFRANSDSKIYLEDGTSVDENIAQINANVDSVTNKVDKALTFTEEGLEISATGSTSTVVITEERINFNEDGYTAAYISGKKLNIPDAVIENSLRIGKFAFVPRNSGNLSLVLMEG